ncbi:probably inactive leucine-rich repeat receptor-like protein kinase IMK2 [Syzygium oleosum]|uniref:probably inactive leucine-rich repeat receptor-like protein kinase IMK2 n=1 Tax=Syzygium oleosum TaxID=219896 RepID=UPI0024BBC74F|nr:probably inactive leucine-rich repeat receptor-like protein kinase IMK2 [Syzygium oleosum]
MEREGSRHDRARLPLFFLLLLAAGAGAHSRGAEWDGVVVTQADYQALRAIKHDLVDSLGVLRSWNDSGFGACSGGWAGIKCVKGQVIAVQLPWKGLGGRISEKIGQLQALRKLSLHDNHLTGAVPFSLGFLPYLRGVYLFNNRLSGTIPPSIGNCPLLQALDLSNNLLSGTIPPSLANSTKLLRLNLSFNTISGSIPSVVSRSASIAILALDHNNISGPIPASITKLGTLQILSLSHNQIGGTIPSDIGELSQLEELDLSFNAINGSLPSSLFNMSSLAVLDLEGNRLDGGIPENLSVLRNLSELNLKNNHLKGPIPSSIGNISSIDRLDLSENNFTGQIPASLVNLPNLTSFNVSYNNLSGAVPTDLSRRFNSSSFVGNLQLCGFSTSTPCPTNSPPPQAPPPSAGPSSRRRRHLSTKDIVLIAAGILLAILLLLCLVLLCCLIKKRAASKKKNGKPEKAGGGGISEKATASREVESSDIGGKLVHFDGPFVFTADDLLCATAEIMGKSAYGTAYKATLEDGNQVAVKRLREKMTKGQKEFEAEAGALGRIRHPNLLALRAYYLGPKGEKLLVFDYMAMGSLASFLHARGPETTVDWPTRMSIAVGVSRGLHHLHTQENIVHGNLTSTNILLDQRTVPHIADYGLSRLMTSSASTTVVATAGAIGYAAPELAKTKKPTAKTDVYSLGVVFLELLTGKSPSEGPNGEDLPQWVASIVKEEWTNEVFDLELMRETPTIGDELLNTLKLALHCVDPSPAARPDVEQVLRQLEEIKPEVAAGAKDDEPTEESPDE